MSPGKATSSAGARRARDPWSERMGRYVKRGLFVTVYEIYELQYSHHNHTSSASFSVPLHTYLHKLPPPTSLTDIPMIVRPIFPPAPPPRQIRKCQNQKPKPNLKIHRHPFHVADVIQWCRHSAVFSSTRGAGFHHIWRIGAHCWAMPYMDTLRVVAI